MRAAPASLVFLCVFGVGACGAWSQSRPVSRPSTRTMFAQPDDRYAKVLAGKKLEEGKGFPGVVSVGDRLGKAIDAFGYGRPNFEWPFWGFYEKGPWELTLCTTMPTGIGGDGPTVHAIIVAGDGAPPTSKGLKVGDPVAKAIQTYGASKPFDGALVGLEQKGRTRTFQLPGRQSTSTVEDPPEFKDALYFPAAKLLVAVENDRVKKLAIVGDEDTLVDFLKPQPMQPLKGLVTIDAKVTVPQRLEGKSLGFLVPPPPALVPVKGNGYVAMVPRDWPQEDGVWKDPQSPECVTIRPDAASSDESAEGALTAMLVMSGGQNHVPKPKRALPADFCRRLEVDAGFCAITVKDGAGKEGLPLRTYHLMLEKGPKRYLISVSRTQHPQSSGGPGGSMVSAFLGSPDGDELARTVMRSFRVAP